MKRNKKGSLFMKHRVVGCGRRHLTWGHLGLCLLINRRPPSLNAFGVSISTSAAPRSLVRVSRFFHSLNTGNSILQNSEMWHKWGGLSWGGCLQCSHCTQYYCSRLQMSEGAPLALPVGRLKTRDLTSRDLTTRHQIAGVDIARLVSMFEYLLTKFFCYYECYTNCRYQFVSFLIFTQQ